MDKILYGAAYYAEYMPCDRLAEDIAMMKKAGINTVRVAESAWSTWEPREGEFDFSQLERVLDAMEAAGIRVIVGTPTYAVPTWLVKAHPQVLAITHQGQSLYGHRQNMDITDPTYRFYAERIIRELMKRTAHRPCVIGFQLDNETKAYDTCGPNVQAGFVEYLKEKFRGDLEAMNRAFGLDYWSNRINAWEDFPDVRGTINGSLGAEFEKYQRLLVEEFLLWQRAIVEEYRRPDQFVTHNFDYAWQGYSCGIHPDIDQFRCARATTVVGTDIYHPGQEELTGMEIAFGGDVMRSLKGDNYLVLETQAQSYPNRTPYPGQLRLQAYSHLASGANSVLYWHWHSIHNACESYWKGLLSHDFAENETYLESCRVGAELERIGHHLVDLKKSNRVAILVSNESLTGLKWFGIDETGEGKGETTYNKVVYWLYDALYRMNIGCDFLWPESEDFSRYDAILVPALYAAPDALLERLAEFANRGGKLLVTFKSCFADENCKISHQIQPRRLRELLGVRYHQFALPREVGLEGSVLKVPGQARAFMELLIPDPDTQVLASYVHPAWGRYAAVTRKGNAVYMGCMTDAAALEAVLREFLGEDGEAPAHHEGVIRREGINRLGRRVHYWFNYSWREKTARYPGGEAVDLLTGETVEPGAALSVGPWDLRILEEQPGAAEQ